MSSGVPSSGRIDHEEPMIPHGPMLTTASNFSVNGTVTLGGINTERVGGYRSIVVQVKNNGTRDLTFTPEWDFYSGAAHIRSTDSQVVAAGTAKRLIFQNQGDLLNKITVTGGGAGDTINHYVAPSNLDPLARNAPDTIAVWGVDLTITAVPGGFSGESPWDATSVQKTGTDVWTYTLDGSGNIVEILASSPGIYESWCSFHFDAPSALTNESCIANIFGTIPIPVKQSNIASVTTTGIFEGMVGALTHFQSGAAIFTMQADFDRNTTGLFRGIEWWVKRWAI